MCVCVHTNVYGGGGGGRAFRCVLCVSVCLCMHKFVGVYDVCVT